MSTSSLNKNNSAIKRIMQEAKELANDPSTDYSAAPLETMKSYGNQLGGFEQVRHSHNWLVLICSLTAAIIGLQGFFPLKGQQAVGVGSIEYPPAERKRLAALSREWVCPHCNESNLSLLPNPLTTTSDSSASDNVSHRSEPLPTTESRETGLPQREPQPSTSPEPAVVHSVDTLLPSGTSRSQTRPGPILTRAAAIETPRAIRVGRKPPLVLVDGAISDKSSLTRRKSLQLPSQPTAVPIPPSLLHSPYLDPHSIFQRSLSMPHCPTEEDEKWLQDTIPLSSQKNMGRLSTLSASSTTSSTEASSPETHLAEIFASSRPPSLSTTLVPASAPIVLWRHRRHISTSRSEPPRVQSAPCLAEMQEFFTPRP
ncbi:hypothetical protein H0H93_005379 [Arthromyces matolae]|nr:hypothetical protein H0H93_005379 [Arthromyces matolae]